MVKLVGVAMSLNQEFLNSIFLDAGLDIGLRWDGVWSGGTMLRSSHEDVRTLELLAEVAESGAIVKSLDIANTAVEVILESFGTRDQVGEVHPHQIESGPVKEFEVVDVLESIATREDQKVFVPLGSFHFC